MKRLLVLFLLCPVLAGAVNLSGTWLSCNPGAPWRYTVLSVDREGSGYRWLAEWGSPYAASGSAVRRGNALELRGCSSYRGDVSDGCDRDNPPVFETLEKSDLERYRKFLTPADLRRARWVRVMGPASGWERLAKQCDKLVAKGQGEQTRQP